MNNYLAKGFFIIERISNKLNILPNDMKLIIHEIIELETGFIILKM